MAVAMSANMREAVMAVVEAVGEEAITVVVMVDTTTTVVAAAAVEHQLVPLIPTVVCLEIFFFCRYVILHFSCCA